MAVGTNRFLGQMDWRSKFILRGFGYHVDVGAFSTPIVGGGAGTILDQDQPEGIISCPTGYMILPIRIQVACHTPLLVTDADESEILIAVDKAAAWAADGTTTAETAVNMNTGHTATTVCTCASAATVNITNPTLGMELARMVKTGDMNGTPANALWGDLALLYEPLTPPVLVGPCAIYVYWGGTVATSGFAQIEWIELPA